MQWFVGVILMESKNFSFFSTSLFLLFKTQFFFFFFFFFFFLGSNVQDGCGHKFQWTSARPYKKMKWDDALKNVDQNQISSDDINKVCSFFVVGKFPFFIHSLSSPSLLR